MFKFDLDLVDAFVSEQACTVTVTDTEINESATITFVISLYNVCEDMSIEIDDAIERMIVLDKDRAES